MKRTNLFLALATLVAILAAPSTGAADPGGEAVRQVFGLRLSKKTASRQSKGQKTEPKKTVSRVTARRRPGANVPLNPPPGLAPPTPLPDLFIANVEYLGNSRIPRFITIGNKGTATVRGCQLYIRYLKAEFPNRFHNLGQYTVNIPQTLKPGARIHIRPPRDHTADAFRAVVDPQRKIRESNEQNNSFHNTW